jgi:exosome complex component RRP43
VCVCVSVCHVVIQQDGRVDLAPSHRQSALMSETLRAVDPLEFYREHLRRGVRPDGRALMRGRKLISHDSPITSADGSALLRLGKTAVIAGVQCEPTAPAPGEAEAARGRIVVGLELPALCSASASAAATNSGGGDKGRLERDKAALVGVLQRAASGGLVELESLCAVEGTAVWSCYCDIYVLEHDGNLLDAALLAMMVALSRVRLPRVVVDEATGALTVEEERAVRVQLAAPLYPCTFGLLAGELLLDPCAEEEALLTSSCTVLVDATGELRQLHKPGGMSLPDDFLSRCLAAARARLPALAAVVTAGAPE